MRLFVSTISSFLAKAIHKIFQEPRPHFLRMFGRFKLTASSCHEYLLFPLGGIWQFLVLSPIFILPLIKCSLRNKYILLIHWIESLGDWLLTHTDTFWHVLTHTDNWHYQIHTDNLQLLEAQNCKRAQDCKTWQKVKLKSACATSA